MNFGARRPKLHVVANFIEALGLSAFRVGDAVGMMAFDETERSDLFMPARMSRGVGSIMASALRQSVSVPAARSTRRHSSGGHSPVDGLEEAASHLAGQQGLVFLISDFHWPLEGLTAVLDLLAHASVVPVVVWDPAEVEPPDSNAVAALLDAESGARRTLWVRPKLRQDWRRAVAQRRAEINAFFTSRSIRPFYVEGSFDADALSRYFFESEAGI
jgi:hypothetical protein